MPYHNKNVSLKNHLILKFSEVTGLYFAFFIRIMFFNLIFIHYVASILSFISIQAEKKLKY